MNGIAMDDFPDFRTKWELVTVRYRKDTGELRFIYANPAAAKILNDGGADYPDGAVYAKIGVKTAEDPAFPSSATPSESSRYQFMVRDKKKYAETGGWGYALFDSTGRRFQNEDPKLQTAACHACHRIVPQRGLIFAQPMKFAILRPGMRNSSLEEDLYRIEFKKTSLEELPAPARPLIPKSFKTISSLQGPMRTYLFDGTLNEIVPLLLKKAIETKWPAALIGLDGRRFSVVFPVPGGSCSVDGKAGRRAMWYTSRSLIGVGAPQSLMTPLCYTE